MPNYEDRRGRYSNIAPWLVGQIKDQLPAIREQAGRRFRSTTAEVLPEIAEIPVPITPPEPQAPPEKDIEI